MAGGAPPGSHKPPKTPDLLQRSIHPPLSDQPRTQQAEADAALAGRCCVCVCSHLPPAPARQFWGVLCYFGASLGAPSTIRVSLAGEGGV